MNIVCDNAFFKFLGMHVKKNTGKKTRSRKKVSVFEEKCSILAWYAEKTSG